VFALALLGLIATAAAVGGTSLWSEYHYWQARREVERHHYDRAADHIASCLWARPNSALNHVLAARIARLRGHMGEASRHLDEARHLLGTSAVIEQERLMVLAETGDTEPLERFAVQAVPDKAINDLSSLDALAVQPDGPVVLEALIHGFMISGRDATAAACAEAWIRHCPNDTEAHTCRGLLYDRNMRYDEAVAEYQKVLAVEPDHAEARLLLAQSLFRATRVREAKEQYEVLLQQPKYRTEGELGLAGCLISLAEEGKAEEVVERVVARAPKNAEALALRGKLALDRGNAAEAETWLRRSLAVDPHAPKPNYQLYEALEAEGKREEARQQRVVAERVRADLARAEEITRTELVRKPDDPALIRELAAIYLRHGQAAQGERWLQKVLQQNPRDLPALRMLADHYAEVGNVEAAQYFGKAVRDLEADAGAPGADPSAAPALARP
jgi:predicted Zn-dependent protease